LVTSIADVAIDSAHMTSTTRPPAHTRSPGWLSRFPEAGLLVVIVGLGALLTFFGGSVRVPKMERGPDGEWQRVFTTNATGERELVFETRNKFCNAQNLAQLAKDTSFIAIMAVGMTFVIITGYIDLSVGAIYALASVLAALVLHAYGPDGSYAGHSLMGALLGGATCLAVGMLCGLLNGGMFVALKVHPFIITLGTMSIFRGIAFVTTSGQSVGSFPESFLNAIRWEPIAGLRMVPAFVMLVVTIVGGIYLRRLAAGRRIYAVGGNELAARYSGVRVDRVKLSVYLFAGFLSGLAALLGIGYYGAATSGDGTGAELKAIAAAVVGGASLNGGRGSALGALLGAVIIQMIESGLITLGIDQNYSQIIIGAMVIVAVLLDRLNNWLAQRRLTKVS
jgi:ribose transport system permease protein